MLTNIRINMMRHRVYKQIRTALLIILMMAANTVIIFSTDAKYVFLMIGDGMAEAQRAAAEAYLAGINRQQNDPGKYKKLTMNAFPAHGITFTYSVNSMVPDSASAATAMACGRKTMNSVVAMDRTRTVRLPSIAQRAKENGMKVGVVSSVAIDDATPACFYAHAPNRTDYYEISVQLARSDFDYFGGGQSKGAQPKRRKGRKDPVDLARGNGFTIVTTREELMALKPGGKVWAFNHTCDRGAALLFEIDRPADHISLAEFTKKGIELLDNPNGFFMVVEGGKIDWACHANDAFTSIVDTLAFDEAVTEAFKFYQKHPEETLIVVTGDHECGGMTADFSGVRYYAYPQEIGRQTMSYAKFIKRVDGFREKKLTFNEALPIIKEIFGFEDLSPSEIHQLTRAYTHSMMSKEERLATPERKNLYGGYEPLSIMCTHVLNRRAGIIWTSFSHTGVPVTTTAIGAGHAVFNGAYDNTTLCWKLADCMGITLSQNRGVALPVAN